MIKIKTGRHNYIVRLIKIFFRICFKQSLGDDTNRTIVCGCQNCVCSSHRGIQILIQLQRNQESFVSVAFAAVTPDSLGLCDRPFLSLTFKQIIQTVCLK